MRLSPEQEEQLMIELDPYIWSIVRNFKKQYHGSENNQDDLHSECVIVLLRHIRSCDTMDDVFPLPYRSMMNAMCCYIVQDQSVSYPQHANYVKKAIYKSPKRVPLEKADINLYSKNVYDDVIFKIDFEEFCKSLTTRERDIMEMKWGGYKNVEIARFMGLSQTTLTRVFNRMRKRYEEGNTTPTTTEEEWLNAG